MKNNYQIIPKETIENRIFLIRGQRVMIDRDLAFLYGVETKYLNRQVRRNKKRFPVEFMFQITSGEKVELVTNCHRFRTMKHSTTLPFAFTEHGVAMLAAVLNSDRAIKISVNIIKIFVKLRKIVNANRLLALKLAELERKIERHDEDIRSLFDAIREIMSPPYKSKKQIGFTAKEKLAKYALSS